MQKAFISYEFHGRSPDAGASRIEPISPLSRSFRSTRTPTQHRLHGAVGCGLAQRLFLGGVHGEHQVPHAVVRPGASLRPGKSETLRRAGCRIGGSRGGTPPSEYLGAAHFASPTDPRKRERGPLRLARAIARRELRSPPSRSPRPRRAPGETNPAFPRPRSWLRRPRADPDPERLVVHDEERAQLKLPESGSVSRSCPGSTPGRQQTSAWAANRLPPEVSHQR